MVMQLIGKNASEKTTFIEDTDIRCSIPFRFLNVYALGANDEADYFDICKCFYRYLVIY
jgi:hypothetical protein